MNILSNLIFIGKLAGGILAIYRQHTAIKSSFNKEYKFFKFNLIYTKK
jgi:hypothetical protein